ncbi:MAG: hypothetical protein RL111_2125 [Pseudomonadota bacterium]|jgi:renalase
MSKPHWAIVGAGMAGVVAARTLWRAGHQVSVFEKSSGASGRMATRHTDFGSFDHGAQYFTVRDERFALALGQVPGTLDHHRAWSVASVRVLDAFGRKLSVAPQDNAYRWVGTPGMNNLVRHWAQPLLDHGLLHLHSPVDGLARQARGPQPWRLSIQGEWHPTGFDGVLLAMPAPQVRALLDHALPHLPHAPQVHESLAGVQMQPCWAAMLAFPQASQAQIPNFGPHWNAAQSTHHRISWLVRESSKPGRSSTERWTVHANPQWSLEHLEDDPARVLTKLEHAFAELTGIRARPYWSQAHRWRHALTTQALGQPFTWDAALNLGTCGDWHLGHRVEHAFLSGLQLAESLC